MRPRRTVRSTNVFRLEGGTEDNDLWVVRYQDPDDGQLAHGSVWVPSPDDRRKIAAGFNIELIVVGAGHPPVVMRLTDEALRGVDS